MESENDEEKIREKNQKLATSIVQATSKPQTFFLENLVNFLLVLCFCVVLVQTSGLKFTEGESAINRKTAKVPFVLLQNTENSIFFNRSFEFYTISPKVNI